MEQNIEYTGMTSQPSDYACGDGEMKLAVNAEYRDGGYHAVRVPKDVEFKKEGFEPLFVHRPFSDEGITIYVGVEKLNGVYTMKAFTKNGENVEIDKELSSTNVKDFYDFAQMGNLFVVVLRGEMFVLRYNKQSYACVSTKIPYLNIKVFAHRLKEDQGRLTGSSTQHLNNKWFTSSDDNVIHPYTVTEASVETTSVYGEETEPLETKFTEANLKADNYVIGKLNELVKENKQHGRFMFPVLLRYAAKMYSGDYVNISPPILVYPFQETVSLEGDVEGRYYDTVRNPAIRSDLYKIEILIDSDNEKILEKYTTDYKDYVESIDFFLSSDIVDVKTSHVYVVTSNKNGNSGKFRFLRSGAYNRIPQISSFYHVKSIRTAELKEYTSQKDLFNGDDYDNLLIIEQRESLKETYYNSFALAGRSLYSHNGRILSASTIGIYKNGVNLDYVCSSIDHAGLYDRNFDGVDDSPDIPKDYQDKYIYTAANNILVKDEKGNVYPYEGKMLPIYFYSDIPKARTIIYNIDDINAEKNLTFSDGLVGSYAFVKSSISLSPNDYIYVDELPDPKTVQILDEPNLIKLSEVGNPFIFRDGNSVQCGTGEILSVASNAMPVTQGQFGDYPLFAFCNDGVYAVGLAKDGSLQSCSIYSHDVVVSRDSCGLMERSVVFVSRQGIISFGDARQLFLSADKTSTYAYDQGKNDHQKTFVENFLKGKAMGYGDAPLFADLYTYLTSGAKMAYDYPHGRLIVYNPAYDYSYVMETKSGMWSIMNKSFSRSLNVYEKCLLVDKDGETVYDYSSDDVIEEQKAYLITRPFKFGGANAHKSVQSIIQRGVFCDKEDVKQCLYASNDLQNWVPVKSSNSIYMRGMRGTGYKYYRSILFLPEFKQDEVLHGASVTFEPRMTNKVR
mgnify:CR=1 FL=1